MARVLTENELSKRIASDDLVINYDARCIEGIKYDFRLGNQFLKSYFARPTDFTQLSVDERRNAVIKPNEFVFVFSEEKLKLPNNVFVQLSQKRKLGHAGIQLFGGFAVDPGYEGHLLFGMYNHSSTDFTLEPGKKLVGAIFHELDEDKLKDIPSDYKSPEPINEFSDELIRLIKSYEPVTLAAVKTDLAELKEAMKKDDSWKQTFQDALDRSTASFREAFDKNKELITQITLSLENEKENRSAADKELGESIKSLSKDVTKVNTSVRVLIWTTGFITAIVTGLLVLKFADII